jgi:hypothetical protein
MTDIKTIDTVNKKIIFDDGQELTHKSFLEKFRAFLEGRVAGETVVPADMERFMRRTSGKSLSQLMKSKKMEGYMEGASDKVLTRGQKIAIGTVITLVFVGLIVFVVLKNQGIIPM